MTIIHIFTDDLVLKKRKNQTELSTDLSDEGKCH